MLKDMMENPDINGEVFTRQRLRSNADSFKKDCRIRAKQFTFQHHHVVEMLDRSYLVCVTDPATDSVLLYSALENHESPYTISDCHPLKFSEMYGEAKRQLEIHIEARAEQSAKRKGRKQVKNV